MQSAVEAEKVMLCAVGDVMPNRGEPAKFFQRVSFLPAAITRDARPRFLAKSVG